MNDDELDELLNRWDIPPAATELRGKVWHAFRPPRRPLIWGFDPKPMFAGTALGAGLCLLLLITQAFPQTLRIASPWFRIPFTVDFEVIDYEADGSSKVDIAYTSYSDKGDEVILSSSMPGHPFVTAVRRVLESTSFIWRGIVGRDHWAGHADFVRAGCVMTGQRVVERTTILGYSTVATTTGPSDAQQRATFWFAPDLGCFDLKIRFEERQPDGSYRVTSEKHALAVTRTGEPQNSQ
jgi:hypothetical protein